MKISLHNFQRFLIYCFVFFGPLGVLLSPPFLPYAFRFYHFFLLFSPLLLLKLKAREWKALLTFIPFLSYCFISAYFTENKPVSYDSYPFFRSGLFIAQYLFMFGAAFCLRNTCPALEKARLLRLYLISFFISLVVGYILFFGYYAGFVSMNVLSRLCVEVQMGWGILRFSPGSYPNEYGNVSSFVLSVLILLLAERKKSSLFLYFFICLTFIALMLATTRAAYFSFAITFFYLCLVSQRVRRFSLRLVLLGSIVVIITKYYSFDFLYVFFEGIKKISLTTGSSGTRITEWIKGFEQLGNSAFFGTGFGFNISAHNVYLELLYEVGLIGFMVFFVSLIYYFSENHFQVRKVFFKRAMEKSEILYNRITTIGLIHVVLFAITNHNMHHHLTWMTFLLFNMSLFSQKNESFEAQKDGASRRDDKRRFGLRFLR
jgi:O-antigen ligase